jgi:hypothetical protein
MARKVVGIGEGSSRDAEQNDLEYDDRDARMRC